jgi:8-oxo-dGTP pyrophosphatase MutT (NUDIX family)
VSLSVVFHGSEDGDDGPFQLASAVGWSAACAYLSKLPKTYRALHSLADKGEASDTARLALELRKMPQPKEEAVRHTLVELADNLGVGSRDETATVLDGLAELGFEGEHAAGAEKSTRQVVAKGFLKDRIASTKRDLKRAVADQKEAAKSGDKDDQLLTAREVDRAKRSVEEAERQYKNSREYQADQIEAEGGIEPEKSYHKQNYHDRPPQPSSQEPPPTAAIDLDGTICEYDGWKGEEHFGELREGVVEGLQRLKDRGWLIIIFTTRGNTGLVEAFLQENDIPYDHVNENPHQPAGTSGKVIADVYVDDRALDARKPWDEIVEEVLSRKQKSLRVAKSIPQEPVAAGLAVVADDTGRVLLLQRQLDPDDPNSGKWEFPGGKLDPGESVLEAAVREWCEETGLPLPDEGHLDSSGAWVSGNGKYAGHVYRVPSEGHLDLSCRRADADQESGGWAAVAWVHPDDMAGHNLRPALLGDIDEVMAAVAKYLSRGEVRKVVR